jgi:hypothetical protein
VFTTVDVSIVFLYNGTLGELPTVTIVSIVPFLNNSHRRENALIAK